MRRALVLSGGGAKGAYQIGVWKALKKLHISFDIVTGTSVGSLNGTLIVQGDYWKAKRLWKKMKFPFVFDNDTLKQYNDCKSTKDMIRMFSLSFVKKGGMDIQKLEDLVEKFFRPDKFFRSKLDFGISTYNFTDLKPMKITKDDLNEKNVTQYVIASSCCFPAFQMKKIGSKKFIDGGFFDYLPINLALDLGADEIIAVDLHAPGIKEKVRRTSVPIISIEPHNDIGSFLNFNQENSRKAMRFGYLDTMKAFHYLEGTRFTFKKGSLHTCQKKYNVLLVDTLNFIFDFCENKTTLEELLTLAAYKRLISMKKQSTEKIFLDILEHLATIFALPERKIYGLTKFHAILFKRLRKTPDISEENVKASIKQRKLATYLNRKAIVRYFYLQIRLCFQDATRKKGLCKLALFFPKEFLDALYLYAVSERSFLLW